MTRLEYTNHTTRESTATYWRTEEDARVWVRSMWPEAQRCDYGIYTLSDHETASLQGV